MTEQPQPWHASAAARERVEGLLAEMTLEEKIELVTGDRQPLCVLQRAIERLGLPPLRMDNGPAGVRSTTVRPLRPAHRAAGADRRWPRPGTPNRPHATAGVAGKETRDQGRDLLEGPAVDLARAPGGAASSRGTARIRADSEIVTEMVRGVQSQGTMADVKHLR